VFLLIEKIVKGALMFIVTIVSEGANVQAWTGNHICWIWRKGVQ